MSHKPTPARVSRIVLHIGTEKTGTSSIQHFLSNNRAAFAAEGVVYPRFTGANGGSQWGVVAAVQERPWRSEIGARLGIKDEASAQAYRQQLIAAIDEELLACPERHTLVLSSEHFHSRLNTPAKIHVLKTLVSRWSDNVQVVVYFRRQDRVAISHYSTKLKTGQANPPVFAPFKNNKLPYYYDYQRIYANWCEVFGKKAVQVGIFAPQHLAGGDLLTDFCDKAALTEGTKKRPAKVNESLSETGVQLLLELNKQWPKGPHKGVNPSRELLVASIAREHKGRSFPATRAQAQAFYAHFVAGNARLAEQAFPTLKGPLFDEDFSDYPDALAAPQANVSKEVRRRLITWRAASVAEQKLGAGRRLLFAGRSLRGLAVQCRAFVVRVGRIIKGRSVTPSTGLPPVFLHVGLPKTGTTTLQNTLFSQHTGVCYLGKFADRKGDKGCATNDVYYALRPIFWQRSETTDPAWTRSVLRDISQRQGADKPLLGSWEALLIKPPKEFQAMLCEAQEVLGDVRVMATLRNPLKRLPSAYLHALRACARLGWHYSIPEGGVFMSFDDWLIGAHREPGAHDPRFDFAANLRFAVKLLGRDKVGVFLLEDMIENRDAFFADMQDFMGVARVSAERIENKHLNKAFTNAELEYLAALDASPQEREQWLALSSRERCTRLAEVAKTSDNDKCRIVLTDTERELIAARSRDLHHWLVDTFELDLARHGYPL
jgi:hypothetical protein